MLLTLPYSFSQLGMVSGIVLQIFYGLVGSWTAYLISVLYIEYRSRKEKEGVSFKNHVIQVCSSFLQKQSLPETYRIVSTWFDSSPSLVHRDLCTPFVITKYLINFLLYLQWFEVLDGLLGPYWKAAGLAFNCTFLLFGSVIQLIACARYKKNPLSFQLKKYIYS